MFIGSCVRFGGRAAFQDVLKPFVPSSWRCSARYTRRLRCRAAVFCPQLLRFRKKKKESVVWASCFSNTLQRERERLVCKVMAAALIGRRSSGTVREHTATRYIAEAGMQHVALVCAHRAGEEVVCRKTFSVMCSHLWFSCVCVVLCSQRRATVLWATSLDCRTTPVKVYGLHARMVQHAQCSRVLGPPCLLHAQAERADDIAGTFKKYREKIIYLIAQQPG